MTSDDKDLRSGVKNRWSLIRAKQTTSLEVYRDSFMDSYVQTYLSYAFTCYVHYIFHILWYINLHTFVQSILCLDLTRPMRGTKCRHSIHISPAFNSKGLASRTSSTCGSRINKDNSLHGWKQTHFWWEKLWHSNTKYNLDKNNYLLLKTSS